MGNNAIDAADFRHARTRSFFRGVWGVLSGTNTKLVAWDEVRDTLGLRGLIRRGVQPVPVAQIIGSVGRYQDFDNAFLPVKATLQDRWRKINRAFYDDVSLPPVTLYKVGEAYFVLDGNHRVSVAREHDVAFLDAEVFEASTRVPITVDDMLDADHLEVLGEYAAFLDRTLLDQLRPQQNIRFTIGGAYDRLIEHIAVHRYFMGLDLKRDIDEDEAVTDWYDNVYMPIITAVRADGMLDDFPSRTESDLYLWIIDHQHYLRANSAQADVDADTAAADYAEKFGEKTPLERMQIAIGQIMRGVLPTTP
jgi:hypothetical protein